MVIRWFSVFEGMEVDMVMGRRKKQNRRGIEGKRKKIKDQRRSDTMIELKLLEENY
jgi:hypothetical protein